MNLTVQRQVPGGIKLPHKDDDHLLFGVHGKGGVEKAAPIECAGSSQLLERRFHAFDAKAKTEGLVRSNFSQLIVGHELDGFAAQQADVAEFAALEHHLREARVVRSGGVE